MNIAPPVVQDLQPPSPAQSQDSQDRIQPELPDQVTDATSRRVRNAIHQPHLDPATREVYPHLQHSQNSPVQDQDIPRYPNEPELAGNSAAHRRYRHTQLGLLEKSLQQTESEMAELRVHQSDAEKKHDDQSQEYLMRGRLVEAQIKQQAETHRSSNSSFERQRARLEQRQAEINLHLSMNRQHQGSADHTKSQQRCLLLDRIYVTQEEIKQHQASSGAQEIEIALKRTQLLELFDLYQVELIDLNALQRRSDNRYTAQRALLLEQSEKLQVEIQELNRSQRLLDSLNLRHRETLYDASDKLQAEMLLHQSRGVEQDLNFRSQTAILEKLHNDIRLDIARVLDTQAGLNPRAGTSL